MHMIDGEWYKYKKTDDQILDAFDYACTELIRAGYRIELHAVNPQIRSAWKKFSTAIAYRSLQDRQTDRQDEIISHEGSINDARGEENEELHSSAGEEEVESLESSGTSDTNSYSEESSEGDSSERSRDKVRKQRARKSW